MIETLFFGRIQNTSTADKLSNNTHLSENTTIYHITENKTTSQVNLIYARDESTSVLRPGWKRPSQLS